MIAGQAIAGLSVIIDQFLAARIGAGAASSLSYASRVMALILGMGAIGISRATLHVFSEVHETNRRALHGLALRWSALAFSRGVLAAVVCGLQRPFWSSSSSSEARSPRKTPRWWRGCCAFPRRNFPSISRPRCSMNYLASAASHRQIAVATVFALAAKIAFLALPLAWPMIEVLAASGVVFMFAWFAALLMPSLRFRGAASRNNSNRPMDLNDGAQP